MIHAQIVFTTIVTSTRPYHISALLFHKSSEGVIVIVGALQPIFSMI